MTPDLLVQLDIVDEQDLLGKLVLEVKAEHRDQPVALAAQAALDQLARLVKAEQQGLQDRRDALVQPGKPAKEGQQDAQDQLVVQVQPVLLGKPENQGHQELPGAQDQPDRQVLQEIQVQLDQLDVLEARVHQGLLEKQEI